MKLCTDLTVTAWRRAALSDYVPRGGSPTASLVLDFVRNVYASGGHIRALSEVVSFTRASTATHFDANGELQTVALDAPRFDHDPLTGEARGLLIEEARTNAQINSQGDTGWTGRGTTPPTVTAAVTHLGQSCTAILFSAASNTGYAGARADRQGTDSVPITAGTVYSQSAFVALSRPLTGSEAVTVYYTGSSGVATYVINAANSAGMAGRWERIGASAAPGVSGVAYAAVFLSQPLSSDLTVYISRLQFETGQGVTSYIPTAGAAVTRAADMATIPATGTVFAHALGTALVDGAMIPGDGGGAVESWLRTNGTGVLVGTQGNKIVSFDGSASPVIATVYQSGARMKAAVNWDAAAGARRWSVNGAAVGSGSYDGQWGAVQDLGLGTPAPAAWLRRVLIWPSVLTDTEMQDITA
ncbi:MAG: hypothetical protein Kow0058_01460 [Roseovarius sp.]